MLFRSAFLLPTEIYVRPCLDLYRQNLVKALCHITGGGVIENLPRILPAELGFHIDYDNFKMPDMFQWLKEKANMTTKEIFRVFNCGIGMALVIDNKDYKQICNLLLKHGYDNIIAVGEIR